MGHAVRHFPYMVWRPANARGNFGVPPPTPAVVRHPTQHDIYEAPPRRPSFYERLGYTQAEFLRALPSAIAGALLCVMGSAFSVSVFGYFRGRAALLFVAACGIGGFVAGLLVTARLVEGSAQGVARAVLPTGKSTPATDDFSREDALLMQRDIAGALESFERKAAADPANVPARLRAADLHAARGDARRAETLYREVQRIPGVAAKDDVYASNRLVDLYDGPLNDIGRAVVELRRLVDRHQGSRAADEARAGLATLKARLHGPRDDA